MWIRSQNREVLVNIDGYVTYKRETRVGELKYVYDIEASSKDRVVHLARYPAEERALQVIDTMQKAIYQLKRIELCAYGLGEMSDATMEQLIFQMPAE